MPTLQHYLERIEQLSGTIGSLQFDSPGIFTNAMTKISGITEILQDRDAKARSLYKISKPIGKKTSYGRVSEMILERVDGKSTFVIDDQNDYLDPETNNYGKRVAAKVPQLIDLSQQQTKSESDFSSSPTRTSINHKSGEIQNLYNELTTLMNQLPNEQGSHQLDEARELKPKYESLIDEITEFEKEIGDDSHDQDIIDEFSNLDADIMREEEEIKQIEAELKSFAS